MTLLDALRAQGITLRSLTEHSDTETAAGRAMGHMIGMLAALAHHRITARTHAGVQATKGRVVKCGRKPARTPQQKRHARHLLDQG
ncbi:MAG TPA: recombinase family protein [Candidatus Tectomicrobia bacterium]